jgi:transposase-like protein
MELSLLTEEPRRRRDVPDLLGELIRLGGRRIIQELMEGEVTEKLGREFYKRRDDGPRGYRNGYKSRKLRTAEGVIEVDVPQVRDTEELLRLAVWDALRKRTDVLERLVVRMYTRGAVHSRHRRRLQRGYRR